MEKQIQRQHSTTSSNVSYCTLILRYFQRTSPEKTSCKSQKLITPSIHHKTIVRHQLILHSLTPELSSHPKRRTKTTATFTGQKRLDDNRSKFDLVSAQDDEQQLARTRLNTRTSSLPAARCISYYYPQGRISDEINRSRINSVTHDRSRSQSHSSSHALINAGGLPTTDTSDHSSSFENNLDDEHRRLNRRQRSSRTSSSYHSGRYSQRAVAQFMHERNKARLRRNQKASRMLGKFSFGRKIVRKQNVFSSRYSLICIFDLLASIYHLLSGNDILSEQILAINGKYDLLVWICQFVTQSISICLQFTKLPASNYGNTLLFYAISQSTTTFTISRIIT